MVTITGEHFSATASETTVSFNGVEAKVSDASETELLAEVTTLAGNGDEGFADDTGADARSHSPEGLAVDASRVLYVADTGNDVIRRITFR